MKEFTVTLPISGYVVVSVEAENEEKAVNEAIATASFNEIEEWECHRHVVKGNIFYGIRNDYEVLEDFDD